MSEFVPEDQTFNVADCGMATVLLLLSYTLLSTLNMILYHTEYYALFCGLQHIYISDNAYFLNSLSVR